MFIIQIAGLKAFLYHVTGAAVAYRHSICLDFMDNDKNAVISAHTCANTIVCPRGAFNSEDFELFEVAIKAVIGIPALSFNIS